MADDKDKLPPVVTLTSLKGGAAVEMFEFELARVLENIDDPNYRAKGKRRITLTFDIDVDDNREIRDVEIGSSAKLAGKKPVTTKVNMGRRQGALILVEFDPRQTDMFDPDAGADVTPINRNKEKSAG